MRKWTVLIVLGVAMVLAPCMVFAEGEDAAQAPEQAAQPEQATQPGQAVQPEEDVEYGYGNVVKVDDGTKEITVSEHNWETDEEVSVVYSIDPNIKLENVNSLGEIKQGASIDIEYIVQDDGKKVVKFIGVYEAETAE